MRRPNLQFVLHAQVSSIRLVLCSKIQNIINFKGEPTRIDTNLSLTKNIPNIFASVIELHNVDM